MKGLLASQTPQGRLGTTHERCSRKTHRNLATKTDEEMDLAVGEGLFWPSLMVIQIFVIQMPRASGHQIAFESPFLQLSPNLCRFELLRLVSASCNPRMQDRIDWCTHNIIV